MRLMSLSSDRDLTNTTAADLGRSQCCLCLYHLWELNQQAFSRMQPHCPNQMLPRSLILSPNFVQLVFSVYPYSWSGLSMNTHSSPACLWCPAFWDTFHSYSCLALWPERVILNTSKLVIKMSSFFSSSPNNGYHVVRLVNCLIFKLAQRILMLGCSRVK